MKIFRFFLLITTSAFLLTSCGGKAGRNSNNIKDVVLDYEENVKHKKVVVAYFSANDDVKVVAEKLSSLLESDIVRIEPQVEYTDEDLDFTNPNSRVNLEDEIDLFEEIRETMVEDHETSEGIILDEEETEAYKEPAPMPQIMSNNAKNYDIIVLGFPVWIDNAPKVIYSFIKDLKNKTIVPFCTNGDMGMIDQFLSNYANDSVRVMSGISLIDGQNGDEIMEWFNRISADFD